MNPARELHAMLLQWKVVPKGQSVYNVRTNAAESAPDTTEHYDLIRAGWLLGEVKRAIDLLEASGEDMSAFRTFIPGWYDALYLPGHQWMGGMGGTTEVVSPGTLATLASFAQYLDKSRIRPYPADAIGFETSKLAADDILTVLRDQDDIAPDEKQYVFQLLDEIRSLLDAKDLQVSVDLIRRINELRGWLTAYEAYLEDKQPGSEVIKKLKKAARVLMPSSKLLFGATGYALGVTADFLAITQGSGSGS